MTEYRYENQKRNVLRHCPDIASDGADVTYGGKLLHKLTPETGSACLPLVERLVEGS